jgi:homoserine dehydrogenase
MSENPLKIAVAGLGTVGGGLLKLLHEQADLIAARAGRPVQVAAISARDKSKDRGVPLAGIQWFDDAARMASEADAEVVVELIGGAGGIAGQVVDNAIAARRHVVTANKALLAARGADIAAAAEKAGVALGFESSVAGGIPILKALREGLAGNRVSQVYGILNGTCNYILTSMRESGRDFGDILAEAQKLGYAEADPATDIDGHDASHKLAVLASLAFGVKVDHGKVHVEGIRHVSALDIKFADELGYRIKLLGIARRTPAGIEQRVHACMVPVASPIATVDGVFNAVVAEGDFVGRTVFEGRGAGAGPTASAVAADLIDIASGRRAPAFGVPAGKLAPLVASPMAARRGGYYVRLMVRDVPGVFADVAAALRDEQVSMEAVLQRGRAPGETVPVVMTIHDTEESAVMRAVARIAKIGTVVEPPRVIRIETF